MEEHIPRAISPRTKHSSSTGLAEASIVVTTCGDEDSTNGVESLRDEAANPKAVLSSGPFASLALPHHSAKANGAYVIREMISTYLITHPHLDHISGFAVNTAALQQTLQPKRVAALPPTIDALKTHIFNDVIWPNLTDENGGVGLVTFLRLVDSGKRSLNEGVSSGYIEVCDGISVNCWSVSHGQCKEEQTAKASSTSATETLDFITSPRKASQQGSLMMKPKDPQEVDCVPNRYKITTNDSAAFFLQDHSTGREALIFGDVEPDSLSVSPRTAQVWTEAANKIVLGTLTGILIECSFEDSQPDEMLFGHLCPRHLVAELQILAEKVRSLRPIEEGLFQRKRKRRSLGMKLFQSHEVGIYQNQKLNQTRRKLTENSSSINQIIEKPFLTKEDFGGIVMVSDEEANKTDQSKKPVYTAIGDNASDWPTTAKGAAQPLKGLKVYIIHVKEILKDGPAVGETILAQLQEHEKVFQLGCTFTISKAGTSIWL